MAISHQKIKKYRRWFGWGFVASLPVVLFALWFSDQAKADSAVEPTWLPVLLAVGSIITSLAFIGFLITAVSTWRKEVAHTAIEREKNKSDRIDLEKLRAEISDKNAAAQDKRNKMAKRKRIV